ncbi:hypothetical protein FRX31_024553 [Thalictrum thalictroides]|uniref:F-box domain-containing protein n=1 Tax=Thalictrum thalictroides TaxID=46969 RepID=A0A7J6VNW6_THATH|nr:hypothetical protein FRX31_024553 [Thalictrum thalictroides]
MYMFPMDNLPSDITAQILSRLPVKYVFRCRSVCKTWLKIIDDNRHLFRPRHFVPVRQWPTNAFICSVPYTSCWFGKGSEMHFLTSPKDRNAFLNFGKGSEMHFLTSPKNRNAFSNFSKGKKSEVYSANPKNKNRIRKGNYSLSFGR